MRSTLLNFGTYKLQDWLSAYRILSAPFIVYAIIANYKWLFLGLAAISLATDAVDGFIARHRHQTTQRGAILDTYGDLLTMALLVAGLLRFQMEFIVANAVLLGSLVGLYLLEFIVALIRYGKPSSFHTLLAKTAFLLLGLLYLILFIVGPINWLIYTAVGLAIVAELEELAILAVLHDWRANVKGLYWVLRRRRAGL